jgi:cell division protein FtsW (lipid II flippase)
VKVANKIIYSLFGGLALVFGVAMLVSPTSLLSEAARSFHLAHLMREDGAAAVFIGLMALWCVFNYERRRSVHYCLMVFTLLLATIHWVDYVGGHLPWISPVYNSVPFTILLIMAVLERVEVARNRARVQQSY